MKIIAFDDSWYAEKIDETLSGYTESSADAAMVSRAILTGFCILAQAIDNASQDRTTGRSVLDSLDDISSAIVTATDK